MSSSGVDVAGPIFRALEMDPTLRAEPYPRWAASQGIGLVDGQALGPAISVTQPITITKLVSACRSTATVTPTLQRMGIYSIVGGQATLLARTAALTNLWAVTFTEYPAALDATGGFPTSLLLSPGIAYWFPALTVGAAVQPNLSGAVANLAGALVGRSPFNGYSLNGQTDLPLGPFATPTATIGNCPYVGATTV